MRQALGPGALGKPRGNRWRGRWEGWLGWGTHVNPWMFHFNVWQNPAQIKKKKFIRLSTPTGLSPLKCYLYGFPSRPQGCILSWNVLRRLCHWSGNRVKTPESFPSNGEGETGIEETIQTSSSFLVACGLLLLRLLALQSLPGLCHQILLGHLCHHLGLQSHLCLLLDHQSHLHP